MVIPIAMVKLDEANAALGEPSGEKAVRSEGAGPFRVLAVEFEGSGRLFRKIGQFGDGFLHPEGHLILRDASWFPDLRIHRQKFGLHLERRRERCADFP